LLSTINALRGYGMNGRTSVSLQYHVFGTKEMQIIPITEDMISRFETIFVYWDSN